MNVPAKRPAYEPAAKLLRPTGYNPDMKRPPTTVAGAGIVLLRVVVGLLALGELLLNWNLLATDSVLDDFGLTFEEASVGLIVLVIVAGGALIVQGILAFLVLRGRNWPRVIVMFISVISICTAFVSWWVADLEITLSTSLLATALDTLILLALSSRSAAAYARRNEQR